MKKLFTLLTLLVAIVTGARGAASTTTDNKFVSGTVDFSGIGTLSATTTYWNNGVKFYSGNSANVSASNSAWATSVSIPAYIDNQTAGKDANKGKWGKNGNGVQYTMSGFACSQHTIGIHVNQACTITVVVNKNLASDTDDAGITASLDATPYGTAWTSSTYKTAGTALTVTSARKDATNAPGRYTLTINVTESNLTDGEAVVKLFNGSSGTGSGKLFCYESVTVETAGAITPTITTETATVEEGKTVSALGFITAKNGTNTLTDVTYSNFAVSAGSEYVSVAADGTITGLTGGAGHTATITFDSDAVTDKYEKTEGNELTVNVVAAKQELTLAYSGDVELTAGQTFTPATLTATAGGNTVDVATLGLTYESSNTDLATVNATTGEVTLVAKATGTATIKAKLQDNATYSDTEASYTITVNKIPVPKFYIDGVEIANGATVADFTTGQTIVIEAPGYYIYSNWSSSDSKSKSDYYKDGGVKGQDSYKASTLTTGKRVLYAVAGDDEHAQGNSSDLAKVIFSSVTAGSIEVSISAAGYATLYYSSLPLAVPANVTAKTYKVDNGNIVVSKTYAAESVIPQGEPVVLEGAAGDYTFTVKKDESATKDANSMLKGLDAAGQTTGEGLFYKLAQKDGKVGFYWGAAEGAAFALQGDHHAYLVVPASTGAREFYAFSEEVSTGINSANVQTVNDNAPIYNLAGQKVSKGYKGIVIVNGRKMLNK